ncbi:MAG: DUF3955 domain-containing protein [Gammaproteobacteria bacterium]
MLCHISYLAIGSEVDSNGYLLEPFGLIPTGYFFYLIGIIKLIYIKLL